MKENKKEMAVKRAVVNPTKESLKTKLLIYAAHIVDIPEIAIQIKKEINAKRTILLICIFCL